MKYIKIVWDLVKEVWQVYLPKFIKAIYAVFLKPQSSAIWVACIMAAYCFIFHASFILKALSTLEVILCAIVYFAYKKAK